MTEYEYVGPAILPRTLAGSCVRRFRGRVTRSEVTGAYRFYVNRTSTSHLPKDWPGLEDFTDDFDADELEWLGKKPNNL
jgi:hypothetical protein